MKIKYLIILIVFAATIFSCTGTNKEYIKTLRPTKLENTDLSISIPENYKIEKNQGPDFDMFYFYPVDTTDKSSLTGGIYYGFNPSSFSQTDNIVDTKDVSRTIFGKKAEWTVFEYPDYFFIQTITDYESADGTEMRIHAFGSCQTEDDMDKLFMIFETLVRK